MNYINLLNNQNRRSLDGKKITTLRELFSNFSKSDFSDTNSKSLILTNSIL